MKLGPGAQGVRMFYALDSCFRGGSSRSLGYQLVCKTG